MATDDGTLYMIDSTSPEKVPIIEKIIAYNNIIPGEELTIRDEAAGNNNIDVISNSPKILIITAIHKANKIIKINWAESVGTLKLVARSLSIVLKINFFQIKI